MGGRGGPETRWREGDVHVHSDVVNRRIVIHLAGRIDFSCHQEFRRAYERGGPYDEYVIDLMGTDYVDSSALGMFLVLREHAGDASVRLANSRPAVRRILRVANFHTLFAMD